VVAYKCCTLHLNIYLKRQFTVGLSRQQPMSYDTATFARMNESGGKDSSVWLSVGLYCYRFIAWKGNCNHSNVIMTVISHQCRKKWRSKRCLPTFTHTHTHTHKHYIHTYITYIHTYIHTYTYITYVPTYVRTHTHTYLNTYIHTYIHTYVST